MTHFANWLSPDWMRPLGWALVHFLWEGAALAAMLSAAMALCRTARARYALAVGTLALMVAAPLGTFFALRDARSPNSAALPTSVPVQLNEAQRGAAVAPASTAPASPASPSPALLWFVEAWMAGVLLLSLRNVTGLVLIERLRRKESKMVSDALREKCVALQRRLKLDRAVRYCISLRLEAPAVIGWFRPVVLLPVTALTGLSEEQLSAVIAHELAHIKRLDSFVNLFQMTVETLLFYHPAVWWVNQRIRAERENCCDDAAIQVCGDALEYARALTAIAERRMAPAMAMALNRSPLEARVMRLLGMEKVGTGLRTAGFAAGFLCLAGAVFAGNVILSSARSNFGAHQEAAVAARVEAKANATVAARVSAGTAAREMVQSAVHSVVHAVVAATATGLAENAYPAQSQEAAQNAAQVSPAQEAKPVDQGAKESYIDSLKSAGLENLTVDQLIALKVQGVTAEYVRGLQAAGLKPGVDEIIAMKVQGITPDYVKGVSDLGLQANADELIALKVQGVTPDYIRQMRADGVDGKTDEFVAMKVQGITPEYVKGIQDLGWKPKADELIALKVQGVTPDYIRQMRANGVDGGPDEFVGMKVQGVTPDYVKELHDLGFQVKADDVIGMKVQGVTPDYVRDIRALGLNPDADEIVGMKVQGVTPEYIKGLQASGLKDLKADDYIGAKVQGVTPEFIAEAQKHGFKDLTLEKLIELKHAGVF